MTCWITDLQRVRRDFPILQREVYGQQLTYLDNAATTQKPQIVLDAMRDYYTQANANIHRGAHYLGDQATAAYEEARTTVKDFIGASSEQEIVFTRGTTDSINLVATALAGGYIKAGDEIIISEMEHHSNIVPWQNLCTARGARLRIMSLSAEAAPLQPSDLEPLLTKRTKLVALTYVSNALGLLNPVEQIIAAAHAAEVPVLVDAAQAVQHLPIDVQQLDCDFLCFSGHKFYAANGIGVLYGKRHWLDVMPPAQFGGGMVDHVSLENTSYAQPPQKFEAGTPSIGPAVTLVPAVQYVRHLGLELIRQHERDLMQYCEDQLARLGGVTVYGCTDQRHGVISFNLEGIDAFDVGMIVDKLGIAVRVGTHCAEPIMQHFGISGTIRASFGLYNGRDDVDRLIEGLDRAKQMLGA